MADVVRKIVSTGAGPEDGDCGGRLEDLRSTLGAPVTRTSY